MMSTGSGGRESVDLERLPCLIQGEPSLPFGLHKGPQKDAPLEGQLKLDPSAAGISTDAPEESNHKSLWLLTFFLKHFLFYEITLLFMHNQEVE